MSIFDPAQDYVNRIVAAGVRATTDPRRVDPPCVLVVPSEVDFNVMCPGEGNTRWFLHVLGPQPGGQDTLKAIAQIVAAIVPVFPEIRTGRMTSYSTDNEDPWPSFDMEFEVSSSWV